MPGSVDSTVLQNVAKTLSVVNKTSLALLVSDEHSMTHFIDTSCSRQVQTGASEGLFTRQCMLWLIVALSRNTFLSSIFLPFSSPSARCSLGRLTVCYLSSDFSLSSFLHVNRQRDVRFAAIMVTDYQYDLEILQRLAIASPSSTTLPFFFSHSLFLCPFLCFSPHPCPV